MFEFLAHPIPAMILLLGLLIFVHEAGHFLIGRACGIAAEIFSIGFGPKIFSFDRWGTEFRLCWVPLGGYVKFAGALAGEEVAERHRGKEFYRASVFRRALTVAAGPVANFCLAVVVYTCLAMYGIPKLPALVGEVMPGSPAEKAGLQFGDKIISINGAPVAVWADVRQALAARPEMATEVKVERDGAPFTTTLTPERKVTKNYLGREVSVGRAGIALESVPSVVAVLDRETPAAVAGLRTGDRIKAVKVNDLIHPVTYFPELLKILWTAKQAGAQVAELTVAKVGVAAGTPDVAVTVSLESTVQSPSELIAALGLRSSQLAISEVQDRAAQVLRAGDHMVAWQEKPVSNWYELYELSHDFREPEAIVTVIRDFERLNLKVPLKAEDVQLAEGRVTLFQLPVRFFGELIQPEPIVETYGDLFSATAFGVRETGKQTVWLVGILAALVKGDIPVKVLGGPISIAKQAGESAKRGFNEYFFSLALISINLGLINLFPIPVLDGGQLLLLGAEAVRRRPLHEAALENFQKIGLVMILALVVLSTYNDLSRYWKSMLDALVGQFQ
jgi:regulator of sigma E protease